MVDPFERAVAQTIQTWDLLRPGDRVVVGVSGGPDSTALLAVLAALRERWQLHLVVAHLDHGLRGQASRQDADFVRRLAERFRAAFVLEQVAVEQLARRWSTSIEAAGRRARYAFFDRVAADQACTRVAVGHHRDDQVETVLLRFLSGAGSDGLAGMPFRRGRIIRPLLERSRTEILAYLKRRQLPFREDESNRSPQFARNRVRNQLLPWLRGQFNRRIDEAIWRLSRLLADEVAYLEAEAAALVERARLRLPAGRWFDAAALAAAPVALRRRALRQILWSLVAGEDALRLEAHHLEALDTVVRGSRQAIILPGGVRAEHQQGRLLLMPVACETRDDPPDAANEVRELPVPGQVALWEPWPLLWAEVLPEPPGDRRELARPGHAYLDYDALGCPGRLYVRRWQAGDRLRPLGAPGTRKLQDVFVDRRIPRRLRGCIPLVTLSDGILWVVGVTIADHARVRPATRAVLHLWIEAEKAEAAPTMLR